MTDQLKTFEAPALGNLKFTVWDREGEPWFIAKEVLKVLEYKTRSTHTILNYIDPEEKVKESIKSLSNSVPLLARHKMSAHHPHWFISESGLYKLIMRSNKPEAQQFQDWVTKVVLPAIRKDGG
ncbi:BRO-N domain-containing protein [Aliiroseovarius crassostreae]|uniref:BRO-N domain-containing protein n=1 Tax=Aliiroseovarius crassostreae TaxID=154981 RepID=UPI0022018874|nr:Bro-N domain-containing protein [Aliiroseovarius crassostreae]UWP89100.1 Bro-N domain-containing protein [Aliiroseovarius crassostreae]